jgi:SprT-like family
MTTLVGIANRTKKTSELNGDIVRYDTASDPTREQFESYSKAYDYFNENLFEGKLPRCILNFSRKSKRTRGFFAPQRWERQGVFTHEISLNPDHLGRPPRETLGTLVHEMVHLWQEEEGTPSRNGYHNKEWGQKMDEVGLTPTSTGEPGGKRTGQSVTHVIVEKGLFARAFDAMPEECLLPWLSSMPGSRTATRNPKVKYTCPLCASNAWGKPGISIVCGECDVPFLGGTPPAAPTIQVPSAA